MKKLILALVIMVSAAACAMEPTGTSPGNGATLDLETWCVTQTPDRCVEAMVYLDWNPGREECVFSASDESRRFWELCEIPEPGGVPVTTVPTQESEAQYLASQQAYENEVARRLPLQDERAFTLLATTHPEGVVTAGFLFDDPQPVGDVENLASEWEAALVAAWRTDYVCLRGLDDWPAPSPSRFAYFDGEQRAARLRQELENSTTPVTGAHIPLAAFAAMEQEALAVREPGVLLEAVQVRVPVAALGSLRTEPGIERVRIADFPIEWIDLSDLPVPECAAG